MSLSVADRSDLSCVVHRYAAAVDERDVETVIRLFAADGELMLPDPPEVLTPALSHRGPDAIRDALAAATSVGRTHHSIDSEVYAAGPNPAVAQGRIAATAHHFSRRSDGITDLVWYLHYDDEYRRAEPGWVLTRRALTIDAIETRPVRRVR